MIIYNNIIIDIKWRKNVNLINVKNIKQIVRMLKKRKEYKLLIFKIN